MIDDEDLIEELARELERAETSCYEWTDEQFEIWWHKDRRAEHSRQTQRARAGIAVKFCRENL